MGEQAHFESEKMFVIFFSENKDRACVCVGEKLGDSVPQPAERMITPGGPQDEHSKNHLQSHAPKHRSPLYLGDRTKTCHDIDKIGTLLFLLIHIRNIFKLGMK